MFAGSRFMIIVILVMRGLYSHWMLFTLFTRQGYQVKYVRNITDIDDKIIKRARKIMNI